MNSIEFQKKLDSAWIEILNKRKKDENFLDGAAVKAHDNYWFTLNKNYLPGVIIKIEELNITNTKFPKAKGWNFNFHNNKITMNVNEDKYKEFFVKLINLILTKIYLENLNGEKSIKCFLKNLIFAKDFFEEENVPRKLTTEEQIGLFGEIQTLKEILGKKFDKEASLSYWTGPSKKHDFTLPKTLLEIKTTSTDTKIINTSSTNQIAPVYDKNLKLIFIQIKKNINGSSLNEIIDSYSKILKEDSELLFNDFILKLTQCRYLDIHKNEYKQKYKIDKYNFFNIDKNFPYIKEYVVPDGLSDLSITYKIDLEKCEQFRINEEELINDL
ncbi:PD-(D/E)XK motif protein [Candidatus Pelagibacter bacterium nBUS_36]|uniref:PD-(D/E)XK motif protein n=1 Tax=Candidatus Pelagibacter bacterium nBUS_36 TaxID=3374194 RepID=UPI003EBE8055